MQEGQLLVNKYRVEASIGSGGMGSVFAVTHVELERRFALKVLHPEAALAPHAIERFRREARTLAQLRNDHVVDVIDHGLLETGLPYLVMELLDGSDLEEVLRTRAGGKLPIDEAADYVLQALDALAEAHANGIVHRDLKPANLFLSRCRDGSVRIKVLDFGISKRVCAGADANFTGASSMLGSPLYMSPEQVHCARDIDARTDIWSLGVILYRLVTGTTPFTGDTASAVLVRVATDPARPMRSVDDSIPEAFESLVSSCLRKDPAQRPQSALALAKELAQFTPRGQQYLKRTSGIGPPPVKRGQAPAGNPDPDAPPAEAQLESTGTAEHCLWSRSTHLDRGPTRTSLIRLYGTLTCALAIGSTFLALWSRRAGPESRPSSTARTNSSVAPATVTSRPLAAFTNSARANGPTSAIASAAAEEHDQKVSSPAPPQPRKSSWRLLDAHHPPRARGLAPAALARTLGPPKPQPPRPINQAILDKP